MSPPPRAVLFDFDGIILDTEWPIYESYVTLYREHGHELSLETYVQCIGSDFQSWSPETHLESLTGRSFDWPTINQERNAWIRDQLATHYTPFPGIEAALAVITRMAKRRAVVSSSSHPWVDGWLDHHGLAGHFEKTICRGDAPRIKPAPDLFLEAARQLEVEPAECLVIEDSFNGMRAAHDAGMTVWAIPNRITEVSDFSAAARVLRSADALAAAFEEFDPVPEV